MDLLNKIWNKCFKVLFFIGVVALALRVNNVFAFGTCTSSLTQQGNTIIYTGSVDCRSCIWTETPVLNCNGYITNRGYIKFR